MTLKYESEILFDLMKRDGDNTPSDVLPYESELKEKYLNQVEGAYPKLQDYRSEWLNYNLNAHLPADFPVESVSNVTNATFENVVPYAYRSAILKGNTLVNITKNTNTQFTLTHNQSIDIDVSYIPKGVLCTLVAKVSENTLLSNKISVAEWNNNLWIRSNWFNNFSIGVNVKTFTFGTNVSLLKLGMSSDVSDTSNQKITFDYFMIIVGDVSNMASIPYFEGMQSVKMPVLTTVGKNLFDKTVFIRDDYKWIDDNGNEIAHETLGYSKNLYYIGIGTFTISGTIGEDIRLFFYDKQGVFKGRSPLFTNTLTFSCDEETYVRIGYRPTTLNVDNIQIEQGTQSTFYEPYKTNILTVNEDVTLRSNGSVYDELDLLTGKLTQRIDEDGEVLAKEVIKTVDLSCINEQGESATFRPIEGTMHLSTSSDTIEPTFTGEVPVEATTQNLMSFANIVEEE